MKVELREACELRQRRQRPFLIQTFLDGVDDLLDNSFVIRDNLFLLSYLL